MYGVCRKMRNAAEMPAAERMSSKSPYDGTDRIRFDGCNLSLRPLQREAPLFSLHPSFPSANICQILIKSKGLYYPPGAQLTAEGCLAAAEKGVKQGVKGRSVVGMAEVAELMEDDVVLEVLRQENQTHVEVDVALG